MVIAPEGAIECISDGNPYEIGTKHPDHGQSSNYSDIRSMVVARHSRLSSLQSCSGHDQGAEKIDRKGGREQNQPAALGRMWRWRRLFIWRNSEGTVAISRRRPRNAQKTASSRICKELPGTGEEAA